MNESPNVRRRNERIDALSREFEKLAQQELTRIDNQMKFLKAVQKGRGAGKIKSRVDLEMQRVLTNNITEFLT